MVDWFIGTLRAYPELAIFFALAIGFWIGPIKIAGFSLGNVTATLLAAVVIGQLAITISPNVKSVFFLLFLFAVGYGVGPQFFQGLAREGPKQIGFAVVVLAFCLIVPLICAKIAGLDLGYAAGLYAGSQTISASIGVATDQIMRLGLPAEQAKAFADKIPIGYAVTYIYGTIGSAIVLAKLGPWLLGIDLPKACADYEKQLGAGGAGENVMSARRNWEMRAYLLEPGMPVVGKTGLKPKPAHPAVAFSSSVFAAAAISWNGSPTWSFRLAMLSLSQGGATYWSTYSQSARRRSTTRLYSTFPWKSPTFS
jgi:putative transport protein